MPKKSHYQLRARAEKSIAARVKAAACFADQTMGQFIRAAVEQRLGVVERNMARQTSFSTSTRAGNVVPDECPLVTDNGSILSPAERDDDDEPTKPGFDPRLARFLEDEYGIEEGLGAQDIED